MNEYRHILVDRIEFDSSNQKNAVYDNNIESQIKNDLKPENKLIHQPDAGEMKSNSENFSLKGRKIKSKKEHSDLSLSNNHGTETAGMPCHNTTALFRLFVKNGEYVYARPNDIIMMESCDHLVKVYLAFNDKIKKTVRHNTLKDFLLQLPAEQFMRIGRFCAVNTHRLSGGNCNEQSFEFDFRVSIKLKHPISHTSFNAIGK